MKQGKLLSVLVQRMDEDHVQITTIEGLEVGDTHIVHGFGEASGIIIKHLKTLWDEGPVVGPLSPDELRQLTDEKEN